MTLGKILNMNIIWFFNILSQKLDVLEIHVKYDTNLIKQSFIKMLIIHHLKSFNNKVLMKL